MDDDNLQTGRFEAAGRLFGIVAALSREKRLSLLERLLGDRIAPCLCRLVIEMPAERRQLLYELLTASPAVAEPVTTLTLDEDDSLMRQNHRRACRLEAIAVIGHRSFEAVITDISAIGLFLKTDAAVAAGEKIRLSTRLPGRNRAAVLKGTVLRRGSLGLAVRFEPLAEDLAAAIAHFVSGKPL